ncbi:MAG TPA: TIGR02677 family protein [Firmicutes bacterium]|nr:TIGR02677 family protein [Bacillota bacterium]
MDSALSLDKQVLETAYLTAQNVQRYRTILRYFYRQHQQLNYWLGLEDVLEFMKAQSAFADYTREQAEQDLNALVQWKNLLATQDMAKVLTLEEFKNRRYRYQLTPTTVEIERLLIKLASIVGVGGSLEAKLFQRITQHVRRIPEIAGGNKDEIRAWWQDMSIDFQRLNDSATDYLASLERGKLGELLDTASFLVYKSRITEYLRDFIKELQRYGPTIESLLAETDATVIERILAEVIAYEKDIPRIEQEIDVGELEREIHGQWRSLCAWFGISTGQRSEGVRLLQITDGVIRRLTRLAYRLAETQNSLVSRRREYQHLARLFSNCTDLTEAHLLSAAIVGPGNTRHLFGEFIRQTDSNSTAIWEEPPFLVPLRPRVRGFRDRLEQESIHSKAKQKEKTLAAYLQLRQEEAEVLDRHVRDAVIDFSSLPILEPHVRVTLLHWVSKAMGNRARIGQTEDGRTYRLEINTHEQIVLRCEDGNLRMPSIKIKFLETKRG